MRCKPEKPALHERPLLTAEQAGGLMTVFKVLANDTRSAASCTPWPGRASSASPTWPPPST